jgi:hypothetical protein
MKRLLSYLLLMMIIFSVSACGSTSNPPVAATTTYLNVQVRADAGDGEATLDWQMVGGATTYNIYYIADPTSTYSSTNKPSSAAMKAGTKISSIISATKTITGLTNGTTYWFAISAVTSSVESDLSIAISATPSTTAIPAAPENVRANAGDAKVTVTWTPVAGVDHYTVYCYTQSGLTINEGIVDLIPQANSSQVVDSSTIVWTEGSNVGSTPNAGLVNGTTYYFFVVSVNTIGKTNTSFFESATPSTNPAPFAPVLTSVTAGNAQITVNWNAVTASPAVASYNIYIGTAKGVTKSSGAKTSITADANPTYSATASVTNGTTYYIVVTAVNSNGESAESVEWWAKPATSGATSGPID